MSSGVRSGDGRPWLVFFYSSRSGPCRRVEGFLAQVLQRRHNHETFALYRVDVEARPDLAARFSAERIPMLAVVDGTRVSARLEQPRGCLAIERFLGPWLRSPARRNGANVDENHDSRVVHAAPEMRRP